MTHPRGRSYDGHRQLDTHTHLLSDLKEERRKNFRLPPLVTLPAAAVAAAKLARSAWRQPSPPLASKTSRFPPPPPPLGGPKRERGKKLSCGEREGKNKGENDMLRMEERETTPCRRQRRKR
jgi:hypothetical protein